MNTRRWWSPRRSVLAVLPRPAAPVGERQSEFRAARRCAALEATSAALVRRGSVIGYESAAVLRGLPVIEIPAVPLLVTPGPDRGPRHGAVLRHRPLDPARVDRWYGAPVTRIVDTILDIARLDRAGGLVAADAALHEGLVSLEELHAEVDRCAGWPGARTARFVVDFAEPRTESPLESLTRLLLHDCGLPVPEPQFVINDPSSRRWARVDFCWPEQKFILEADGRLKYDRDDRWREKTREGWLRRLGYKVERVVWDDVVRHPAETGAAVAKWLASRSV